jgi:predicted enzyme related to lactoylglutathione lyase
VTLLAVLCSIGTAWTPGRAYLDLQNLARRHGRPTDELHQLYGLEGFLARSQSWQDSGMERVLGIGGYFMRAADPVALGAWYRDCLGLDADENGLWRQEAGPTVFATFESGTGYFGSRAQQAMLNFRVRDLDAMLAQLRAKGADVAEETQDMDGVGRFGWVTDPEGNRVELWQPA